MLTGAGDPDARLRHSRRRRRRLLQDLQPARIGYKGDASNINLYFVDVQHDKQENGGKL